MTDLDIELKKSFCLDYLSKMVKEVCINGYCSEKTIAWLAEKLRKRLSSSDYDCVLTIGLSCSSSGICNFGFILGKSRDGSGSGCIPVILYLFTVKPFSEKAIAIDVSAYLFITNWTTLKEREVIK